MDRIGRIKKGEGEGGGRIFFNRMGRIYRIERRG